MTLHIQTPVESWPRPHRLHVQLKMECFQPVGSFKIRGIGHLCERLVADGVDHLVSSSGGNAGFATAWAGRQLGVPVTVVTPSSTPQVVCDWLRGEKAEVLVHGSDWAEANDHACRLAESNGAALVHPFDHELIWAGHASLVRELTSQLDSPPDAIVVAVGGGGLLAGIDHGLVTAAEQDPRWAEVDLIGVETFGAASLAKGLAEGKDAALDGIDTVAVTLGARQVCRRALQATDHRAVHSLLVNDKQAIDGCVKFANDRRVLVEPSCGAALAPIYDDVNFFQSKQALADYHDVLVVVCGGIGVNLHQLKQWQAQFGLDEGTVKT